MIESILLDYLSAAIDFPVRTERDDGLEEYVLIEKTGSRENNGIELANVAIQSWGKSLYRAALINKAVKTAMSGAVIRPDISRVKCTTDYNFTDTTTHKFRYQALFEVVFFDD